MKLKLHTEYHSTVFLSGFNYNQSNILYKAINNVTLELIAFYLIFFFWSLLLLKTIVELIIEWK